MKTVTIILLFSFIHINAVSQINADDLYMKAIAMSKNGDFEKAIETLNKATNEDNSDEKLFFLLGKCHYKNNEYESAANNFIISYKLKNNNALYNISECFSQLNQPYKSVEYLKLYLETKDKLLRSEIKTNKAFGNIENSKAWIGLWKENHYNNYEKKLDEAKYMISKEDYANAFDILDKLLIKSNKRYRAFAMRGDLLYLTGDFKNAAKDYITASGIKKKNLTYKTKAANALFKSEKIKKSLEFYNRIDEEDPYEIEFLINKANAELMVSDYSDAQNTITKYLKYFPENSEALNISGKIYYYKKDYINALIRFNLCLKNDQSKAQYFINRGDTYTATKMYENAVYDYSMALDLNPKQAEVFYKRGIANLNLNKYDSCRDFEEALKLNYNKANDYIIKYCK